MEKDLRCSIVPYFIFALQRDSFIFYLNECCIRLYKRLKESVLVTYAVKKIIKDDTKENCFSLYFSFNKKLFFNTFSHQNPF